MTIGGYEAQTDRELAIGAANGDQRAFAALYDRYFDSLYDFAVRTLRETDRAADVVQGTFGGARESLGRGEVPPNVGASLFNLARNAAIAEPAERPPLEAQRTDHGRPMPSFVEVDAARMPSGQAIAPDREQRELVWESATELGPREYSLLDMNVRRGLSLAELAAALGMRADGAEQMLARLRESLERTAAASLLIRRGGGDCPDLGALLARSTGPQMTPELRQAVQKHLEACARCQANAAGHPSAIEVLAAFTLVAATVGLREVIWGNVVAADVPPATVPTPVQKERRTRWPLVIGLAVLAILLIGVPLAILLTSGDGGGPQDPDDVHSTSHEVGQPSTDNVVRMVWSRQEGVRAYSVTWSKEKFELPDEVGDLSGAATEATSPELEPGDWYFHLRTQAEDGEWTATVHVGPFPIETEATPTPEPTPEETETPEPEPTEEPVPTEEPETPTPQPTDTVTATARP